MKYTDVAVGPMSPDEIGKEISHYLNSCKEPSKMMVSIKKREDGRFQTRIYITVEDFKKKMCGKCTVCGSIIMDVFSC